MKSVKPMMLKLQWIDGLKSMIRHSDQYKALVLGYSIFAKFFFLPSLLFFILLLLHLRGPSMAQVVCIEVELAI